MYITDVYTDSDFRKQGKMYELMKSTLKPNCTYILDVDRENIAAISLYKKLGFEMMNKHYITTFDNHCGMKRKPMKYE